MSRFKNTVLERRLRLDRQVETVAQDVQAAMSPPSFSRVDAIRTTDTLSAITDYRRDKAIEHHRLANGTIREVLPYHQHVARVSSNFRTAGWMLGVLVLSILITTKVVLMQKGTAP